jgi:hypothetical protein
MRKPGFVALISVLIMSALGILIGSALLIRAIGRDKEYIAEEEGIRAQVAATYCAEYALMALRNSTAYAGNETTTTNDGSTCSVLGVGGSGNTNRTVTATSTVLGATRRITVTVPVVSPVMSISSWQDTP